MIQSKINDIVDETDRLRSEIAEGNPESRKALENKHDDLLKVVQNLEGELSDYNLAKEQARSGASAEDIKKSTLEMTSRNAKMEEDIDKVFFSRKNAEDELSRVEAELKSVQTAIESKFRNQEDDSIKIHDFRALILEIESALAETTQEEDDTLMMQHKIKMMDMNNSQNKEDKARIDALKREIEQVEEDIQLAGMTKDEAREHLLGKLYDAQYETKKMEEKTSTLDSELNDLREKQKEMRSELRKRPTQNLTTNLFEKEHKMKQYLEQWPENKSRLEWQCSQLLSSIETLCSNISEKEKEIDLALPSSEEVQLMQNEVQFTKQHLNANLETNAMLQHQKKLRMEELSRINSLEERMEMEVGELEQQMSVMRKDIERFGNVGELQNNSANCLGELRNKYSARIQLLDDVLKKSSSQYRQNMESLEDNSAWKEIQTLKSKLRDQGKELFKIQEEARNDNTGGSYDNIKADCLVLIKEIQEKEKRDLSQ